MYLDILTEVLRLIRNEEFEESQKLIQGHSKKNRSSLSAANRNVMEVYIKKIVEIDKQLNVLIEIQSKSRDYVPHSILITWERFVKELKRERELIISCKKRESRGYRAEE